MGSDVGRDPIAPSSLGDDEDAKRIADQRRARHPLPEDPETIRSPNMVREEVRTTPVGKVIDASAGLPHGRDPYSPPPASRMWLWVAPPMKWARPRARSFPRHQESGEDGPSLGPRFPFGMRSAIRGGDIKRLSFPRRRESRRNSFTAPSCLRRGRLRGGCYRMRFILAKAGSFQRVDGDPDSAHLSCPSNRVSCNGDVGIECEEKHK